MDGVHGVPNLAISQRSTLRIKVILIIDVVMLFDVLMLFGC